MNPIPPEQDSVRALATDDEERSWDGFASDAWPLKSLYVTLVLIKSSAERPNQRSIEYGIILTIALVSTNILLTV
jgi:hypothetical protein